MARRVASPGDRSVRERRLRRRSAVIAIGGLGGRRPDERQISLAAVAHRRLLQSRSRTGRSGERRLAWSLSRAGLAAGCTRGVATPDELVERSESGSCWQATAHAGFPHLAPSPSGGSKAPDPSAGGWSLEISTVEGGEKWTGMARGSTVQSDPYVSIWGPAAFPPVSTAAGPSRALQTAADSRCRNVGAVAPPYAWSVLRASSGLSSLGLPSSIGTCRAAAVAGWLLTYRAADDSWWWVRSDKTGEHPLSMMTVRSRSCAAVRRRLPGAAHVPGVPARSGFGLRFGSDAGFGDRGRA